MHERSIRHVEHSPLEEHGVGTISDASAINQKPLAKESAGISLVRKCHQNLS